MQASAVGLFDHADLRWLPVFTLNTRQRASPQHGESMIHHSDVFHRANAFVKASLQISGRSEGLAITARLQRHRSALRYLCEVAEKSVAAAHGENVPVLSC
jgi:hypothetical protein